MATQIGGFEQAAIVHFIRQNDMRRKEARKILKELKALLPKDLLQALQRKAQKKDY